MLHLWMIRGSSCWWFNVDKLFMVVWTSISTLVRWCQSSVIVVWGEEEEEAVADPRKHKDTEGFIGSCYD